MAQSLKQIRNRIHSVEGVEKITRVMEMVSTAKLKPIQRKLIAQKDYYLRVRSLLFNLLSADADIQHPLVLAKKNQQKILLGIVTSDTGLCGSYNNAVTRRAEEFIRQNKNSQISLLPIGRKGLNHFKNSGLAIQNSYTELFGEKLNGLAEEVSRDLTDNFLSVRADEVYICYTQIRSASSQVAVVEKILPIEKEKAKPIEYLIEPDLEALIEDLVPAYVLNRIRFMLLSAFCAENSSRVVAMHEATKNASDLRDDLVLLRNKIRQANITTELIEVIASADVMKG